MVKEEAKELREKILLSRSIHLMKNEFKRNSDKELKELAQLNNANLKAIIERLNSINNDLMTVKTNLQTLKLELEKINLNQHIVKRNLIIANYGISFTIIFLILITLINLLKRKKRKEKRILKSNDKERK